MIKSYFESEKRAAFFALALGLAACSIASAIMISAKPPFYLGLAIPLMAIGILEVIVGASVARRSDFQIIDLQKLRVDEPKEFVQTESLRMGKVMRNFNVLNIVEIVLIILGLTLILFNKDFGFNKGLGAGLFVQASFMLVFDFFAEKRGKAYADFVNQIHV